MARALVLIGLGAATFASLGTAHAETLGPSDCVYQLDMGPDRILHGRTDKLNLILFQELANDGFERLQGRANAQDVQVCSMSGIDSDGTNWGPLLPSNGFFAERVTAPGIGIASATLTGRQLFNCETTTYQDGGTLVVTSATARIVVTDEGSGQSWNVAALPGHVLTVSTVRVGDLPNTTFSRPFSARGTLTTSASAGNQRIGEIKAVACDSPAAATTVLRFGSAIPSQIQAQVRSALAQLRHLLPAPLLGELLRAFGL